MYKAEDKEPYNSALSILTAPVQDEVPTLTINDVAATGRLDPNKAASHKYWIGFTERQIKDRERKSTVYTQDFTIPQLGGGKAYSFIGTETVTWINDLDETSDFYFS